MANAKARCSGCKDYRLRADLTKVGLVGVCGDNPACRKAVLDRHKTKVTAKTTKRSSKPSIPLTLRKEIHARDKTCRFCGKTGYRMEVHHINYRSQGGPDANWNLILLCDEHHQLAHSDKRLYQPLLRAYIWFYYAEGKRGWLIPKVSGALAARAL